jgi:hypothetical protein
MKRHLLPALLSALCLVAASRPALAAAPKAGANSLVAALQAVSPDPLGGRLGLAAATARAAALPAAMEARSVAAQSSSRAEHDRRAYLLWKSTQKS